MTTDGGGWIAPELIQTLARPWQCRAFQPKRQRAPGFGVFVWASRAWGAFGVEVAGRLFAQQLCAVVATAVEGAALAQCGQSAFLAVMWPSRSRSRGVRQPPVPGFSA